MGLCAEPSGCDGVIYPPEGRVSCLRLSNVTAPLLWARTLAWRLAGQQGKRKYRAASMRRSRIGAATTVMQLRKGKLGERGTYSSPGRRALRRTSQTQCC